MLNKQKKSYIVPESAAMQVLEPVFLMTAEVSNVGNGGTDVSEDPILTAPGRKPF